MWLARPAADWQSFKDIVVDLAGPGAVWAIVEMSARARGSDLQVMLAWPFTELDSFPLDKLVDRLQEMGHWSREDEDIQLKA